MPRKTGTIKSNKTFLLVVEGETEYKYFEELKQSKKIKGVTVKVAKAKHSQLEFIFQTALSAQESKVYDSIWCVYDYDVVSKNVISENAKRLKQSIRNRRICIADSYPEFEIWLLLHYTIPKTDCNKNELIEELKKYLPSYKKAMNGVCSQLEKTGASIQIAITNSKTLAKRNEGNKNKDVSFCNVYKIFEELDESI